MTTRLVQRRHVSYLDHTLMFYRCGRWAIQEGLLIPIAVTGESIRVYLKGMRGTERLSRQTVLLFALQLVSMLHFRADI